MRDNRYIALIFLMTLLNGMLLCPQILRAQGVMDLPSVLVPRLYRNPDVVPYGVDRFYKGLSLELSWTPQIWVHSDRMSLDAATNGWNFSLGKDFDKHGTLRAGFERQNHSSALNVGYEWNLSNSYWGFDPNRSVLYLLTMGAMSGKSRSLWWGGGYLGLQMRKTLAPAVDVFVEPQLRFSGNHTDGYTNQIPLDVSGSLHAGLHFRLTPPYMSNPSSDYLLVNRYHGLQRLYVELSGGLQFTDSGQSGYNHNWGSVDMNVGYQINQLWGLRTGIFSEQINLENSDESERYFGLRAEFTANLLPLFWSKSRFAGWVFDMSVGGEAGRLETGLHLVKPYYHNYGITWSGQLRRRVYGGVWAFLQARKQSVSTQSTKSVYTTQLGVHYELSGRKNESKDVLAPLYIIAGAANIDATCPSWQVGVGYDFSPIHGIRCDYISSRRDLYTDAFERSVWNMLSIEYFSNLSNAVLGRTENRRLNLLLMTGYNLSIYDHNEKKWFGDRSIFWGIEAGCQFEFQLMSRVSLYCEEKSVFQPFDTHVSPIAQQAWHIIYSGGLKIKL